MLLLLLAGAALTPLAVVLAGTTTATRSTTGDLLAWGQELFALNCAVCHGATGGGLAEAKLAFPADHRNCTRCHRPNNRIVQPLTQPFEDNNMFSIGDPPALHRLATGTEVEPAGTPLAAVADPGALLAYVTATMPRYDPGRLSEGEYVALTAHLLALNGRSDAIDELPEAAVPAR